MPALALDPSEKLHSTNIASLDNSFGKSKGITAEHSPEAIP
jgi:hypothetical protein